MSLNRKFITVSCTVLIFCTTLTWALRCFQCQLKDGMGDAGCGENPPPEKYLRECAQPQCWLRYSSNGTLHVERFCVAVATNMNGCTGVMVTENKGMQHTGMECKCNDTDGCNGKSPTEIQMMAGGNGNGGNNNGGDSGQDS